MSDTPQLLLAHHLKALKLPTFLREYDKQARQCAAEGVDHVRYLVRLTELELIDPCLSGYHPHPLYVVCTHFPE